jgi:membrane-associated protein
VISLVAVSLSPDSLLASFGLLGLLTIIFAECGLLVGFFLPGDTLLFAAGVLVANNSSVLPSSIALICVLVSVAAVAGNLVGYQIGRKAGPAVFRRPQSFLFRPEHLERTSAFFTRFGGAAVLLARFVPIVRTFITVLAGASRMQWRTYALYSLIGGTVWGTAMTLLGFSLGQVVFLRDHLDVLVVGAVLLSVGSAGLELFRRSRKQGQQSQQG